MSRLVVIPVDEPIFHVSARISVYENEQICLRAKHRGFPESYLEKREGIVNLEEIAEVNEENMEQLNDAIEQRVGYTVTALWTMQSFLHTETKLKKVEGSLDQLSKWRLGSKEAMASKIHTVFLITG